MTAPPEDTESKSPNDIALFVDWENLKFSLHEREMEPNITALLESVQRYGRLVVARAYADWQDYYLARSHDQANLYYAGIEPVFVPSRPDPRQTRRKNTVDVKMSTDALEVCFTNRHIKTFVLVSGDADFIHIANALRFRGNRVIMIGVSWSTSERLSERVDDLLFYDQEIAAASYSADPHGSHDAPPLSPASQAETDALLAEIVALMQRQREIGEHYPALFTWLNLQLRGQDPDFSPQKYGFPKFKDLMQQAAQQGRLKVVTRDLVNWALLPEDDVAPEDFSGVEGAGDEDPPQTPETGRTLFSLNSVDPFFVGDNPLADHPDVYSDVTRIAEEIEAHPRFRYMTVGYLSKRLWQKRFDGPDIPPPCGVPLSETYRALRTKQVNKLVEVAAQAGLIVYTNYTDPFNGLTFQVVRLNRAHPFVQRALANNSETSDEEEMPLPAGTEEAPLSLADYHAQ